VKPTQLRTIPREKLERMALHQRRHARNALVSRQKLQIRAITTLGSVGIAGLTGYIMGGRIVERERNLAAIEAGQMPDPTQIGGIDAEPIIGGAVALGGIFLHAKAGEGKANNLMRILGQLLEAGGVGVLSYYSGSRFEAYGQEMARQLPAAA